MTKYEQIGRYKISRDPIIKKDCLYKFYREVIDVETNEKKEMSDLAIRVNLTKEGYIVPWWIDGFIKSKF